MGETADKLLQWLGNEVTPPPLRKDGAAAPPAATPAPTDAYGPSVVNQEYVPPADEALTSGIGSAMGQADSIANMTPGIMRPRQQGVWVPESEDYYRLGGEQGESTFRDAFDTSRSDEAVRHRADIESQAETERANILGTRVEQERASMAAVAAKRAEMREETERRQSQIDATAQMYTADLANQNKFWMNPGNIISSIALSLMPVFGGDPAAGAKLINQNIDRDMANRRQLAETHMGALRSNLSAYRQMMGDDIAGDLLAKSEAHRVAAMEIERISAQMKSKTARDNATILIEDQHRQANVARMNAYRIGVYKDVSQMTPQQLAAHRASPGFKVFGALQGGQGASVPGAPYSQARSVIPGTSSPTTVGQGSANGVSTSILKMSYRDLGDAYMSGKLTQEQLEQAVGIKNMQDAMASSNPEAYMTKMRDKITEGVGTIAKANAQYVRAQTTLSEVQRQISALRAWAKQSGKDGLDELLQPSRFLHGGVGRFVSEVQQWATGKGTKEAELARSTMAMSNQLYNSLKLLETSQGKEMLGNLTDTDNARLKAIFDTESPNLDNTLAILAKIEASSTAQMMNSIWQGNDPRAAVAYIAGIRSQMKYGQPRRQPMEGFGMAPPPPQPSVLPKGTFNRSPGKE